ncbi:hypothetical protein ACLKA6_001105 [Drosophila palustris]
MTRRAQSLYGAESFLRRHLLLSTAFAQIGAAYRRMDATTHARSNRLPTFGPPMFGSFLERAPSILDAFCTT